MADVRLIDKSNKRNIYCDHCEHYERFGENPRCKLTGEVKWYYNRCKRFEWRKSLKYKQD